MNLIFVDNSKKNKKELNVYAYDLPQKVSNKEYIAPASNYKGKRCTFQGAMKLTLIIGQCFGLNPVLGICETDVSKLRFSLFSARTLYSYFAILGQMWLTVLCGMKMLEQKDSSFWANTSLVFYGSNGLKTILFLRMATKWPTLCQLIAKTEAADPNVDANLVKKCNISCVLILILALAEHLLSNVAGLSVALDCQPDTPLYDAFLLSTFPWVWTFFYYSRPVGIMAQILNIQCTFNWNFADVFVICISFYLTGRLKQTNERMDAMRGKNVPTSFWRTMREDYSRTANLIKKVDSVINGIIFISFANNVFYICLQLLHILEDGVKAMPACDKALEDRPFKGYEQAAYFMYSFGFLLARSMATALIAAQVHSASRGPARTLYDVPSSSYCLEVQRFLDQVHGETVSLSGLQFFNVQRGLVLTVAGAVVTYELVLMQFTGISPTILPPPLPSDDVSTTVASDV